MRSVRLLGLFAALFVAAYLGMRWLYPSPPTNSLPAFHRVDATDPRVKAKATSFVSGNDATRDALRHAVIDSANRFGNDPHSEAMKALYVQAATRYAQAWLSIVPCVGTESCCWSDSPKLDRAAKAFGSPLDHRVRDAMRKAHQAHTLTSADFPAETLTLIAELAGDGTINPDVALDVLAMNKRPSVPPANCVAQR